MWMLGVADAEFDARRGSAGGTCVQADGTDGGGCASFGAAQGIAIDEVAAGPSAEHGGSPCGARTRGDLRRGLLDEALASGEVLIFFLVLFILEVFFQFVAPLVCIGGESGRPWCLAWRIGHGELAHQPAPRRIPARRTVHGFALQAHCAHRSAD